MKINKLFVYAAIACVSWIDSSLTAQVRIGQETSSVSGAVLDLNADAADAYRGGLRLPQVKITNKGVIPAKTIDNPNGFTAFSTDVEDNNELAGLTVYNIGGADAITPGVYYWNGTEWEGVVTSGSEGVVVPGEPIYAQRGLGKFTTGRRCVTLNDIEGTDLNATVDGIQNAGRTYTFKASEPSRDFRFVIQDPNNILASYTINSGTTFLNNGETASVTVTFRSDLVDAGVVRSVSIYATYKRVGSTIETVVPVNISIRDHGKMCCFAKINSTKTKEFMCTNLGADDSKDPQTAGYGYFFQWGQSKPSANTVNNAIQILDPAWNHIENYNPENRWDDATTNRKSIKDPCPEGWRIPTREEWTGVSGNNQNRYYNGFFFFGDNLILPSFGLLRDNNGSRNNTNEGHYWTTTPSGNNNAFHFATFTTGFASTPNSGRGTGAFIRCMVDNE